MRRALQGWGVSAITGLTTIIASLLPLPAAAETVRIATYNVSLSARGPGLLFKDLSRDAPPARLTAIARVIAEVGPDVLLINEFDYDAGGRAAEKFGRLIAAQGRTYEHVYTAAPNSGFPSGLDLDGDGDSTGPGDAFGYGRYPGQGGMVIYSRFPVLAEASRTFTDLRWRDLPGAILPRRPDGQPWPSEAARDAMRLSSRGHWDVAIALPEGPLHLFASHPTPPVFDGGEDRNGRRNHDEIAFWLHYLQGTAFADDAGKVAPRADAPFVVLGTLNADPRDGEARREAIRALLAHPALTDPQPVSAGAVAAARAQGGANDRHRGPHGADTSDWNDRDPGNLRVDYVLPAASLTVVAAGVFWPEPGDRNAALLQVDGAPVSDHHLVWVDIALPPR